MTRRPILAFAAAAALSVSLAAPASAVKPARGCADPFDLWTIGAFREWMNNAAFVDSLSPEGQALAPDIEQIKSVIGEGLRPIYRKASCSCGGDCPALSGEFQRSQSLSA